MLICNAAIARTTISWQEQTTSTSNAEVTAFPPQLCACSSLKSPLPIIYVTRKRSHGNCSPNAQPPLTTKLAATIMLVIAR
jgi:hypothetical protein